MQIGQSGIGCGVLLGGAFLLLLLGGMHSGCKSSRPKFPPAWELGGQTQAYHTGPYVVAGLEGPRQHLLTLIDHWPEKPRVGGPAPFDPATAGWQPWMGADGLQGWLLPLEARVALPPGAKAVDSQGGTVVIQVLSPDLVWEEVLRGMQAWTEGTQTLELDLPRRNLVVTKADQVHVQQLLTEKSWNATAWIGVSEWEQGPCTLYRGPDPMSPRVPLAPKLPGAEAPVGAEMGNGLALILRMALVDVGLEARPWQSVELTYDGWPDEGLHSFAGIAHARIEMGVSNVDLGQSERPNLGDADRAMLALWSSVQCLCAPNVGDLARYTDSLKLEMRLRHNQDPEKVETWKRWLTEARLWLRGLTLDLTNGVYRAHRGERSFWSGGTAEAFI